MRSYNEHVADNTNALRLIQKCDRNKDRILDTDEVHELLKVQYNPHPAGRSSNQRAAPRRTPAGPTSRGTARSASWRAWRPSRGRRRTAATTPP